MRQDRVVAPISGRAGKVTVETVTFGQNRGAKIEDRCEEMAKGTFGERLKRERELREVTVAEIASATRIAPKFLDALENEQWASLPGGVFGRGFVRSIARYLGLSEEDLLSEYDLARGETTSPLQQKPEERIPSAPKWIPALAVVVLIGALALVILGGHYAWRWYTAHRAAKKASAVVGIPCATPAEDTFLHALSSPANPDKKLRPLELSIAAFQSDTANGDRRRQGGIPGGTSRRTEFAVFRE